MEDNEVRFPLGELLFGTFVGSFLSVLMFYPSVYGAKNIEYTMPIVWVVAFLVTFLTGFLPMYIAWNKNSIHKNGIYWLAFFSMIIPFGLFFIALVWALLDNPDGIETREYKKDIVNNEKYINSNKNNRIKYLLDLKTQTVSQLKKTQLRLKKEQDKLNNVPEDVAKYINKIDTSYLEKDIKMLEIKIKAINELIDLDTIDTHQKQGNTIITFDDEDD